jgi:3-methyladenine DNA glycosylase AlkD
MLNELKLALELLADPAKAVVLAGFFRTGQGQYGQGDVFLGITVPKQRALAAGYVSMTLPDIARLLSSPVHEHRLTALIILVSKYEKAAADAAARDGRRANIVDGRRANIVDGRRANIVDGRRARNAAGEKKRIFDFYLSHTSRVNNWDLADLSAPNIVGGYLLSRPRGRGVLYRLARSSNLWERRIAILATYAFIRAGQFEDTLKISKMLLGDSHDLIHKAVGWMLREVGKRDLAAEEAFLKVHAADMPRTALRYAIERFPEKKRKAYLAVPRKLTR